MSDEDLDRTEKLMLRVMLLAKRDLSTAQIAAKSKINWKTADQRLIHLQELGFVESHEEGEVREYKRGEKNVKARRLVKWTLLYREE